MVIGKLKPDMVVYDIVKHKLGNTKINTVSVYEIKIISTDILMLTVEASYNSNPPRTYYRDQWWGWRLKKPVLVDGLYGNKRLKTRKERVNGKE